jgi:hypothetical protein
MPRSTEIRRGRFALSVIAVAATLLPFHSAFAQWDAPDTAGWSFELTPYFWAIAVEGDVGVRQLPDVEVDASFSDIWDQLDFAFMGMFEARRNRWGILFDAFYADLSADTNTRGPLFGKGELELVQQVHSLALAYRVIPRMPALDVVGGVRYVYTKTDLDLGSGILPGRSESRKENWFDGFVGLRAELYVTDRWSWRAYADIGAGGSDLTWQALGTVNYRFSDKLQLQFGYRYLSIDYDDGSGSNRFLYDVDFSGPYVGLQFRF